jgi:hypothetical protein
MDAAPGLDAGFLVGGEHEITGAGSGKDPG